MILALVLLNILGGLALESYGASQGWAWAETVVNLVTIAHLGYYFLRPPATLGPAARPTILICLLLATFGELILSAVFGLYTYRVSLLPLFVPPGHVLLFISGLLVARHRRCPAQITRWVPLLAGAALAGSVYSGNDYLSVPLFAVFIACIRRGSEPKLYAVMFVLALGLELYGTWLKTWVWAPTFSSLRLPSANPPLAAGVFYALLDLLTVWLTSAWMTYRLSRQPQLLESPASTQNIPSKDQNDAA